MKVEVNILDCPGHIFSGYYGWYRVQAETKLVLKSSHYTLHFASQQLILSFASKKKKKKKKETTKILSSGMDSVVTLPYLISE